MCFVRTPIDADTSCREQDTRHKHTFATNCIPTLSIHDFTVLKFLGTGALAHVDLVVHNASGKHFALKKMVKSEVVRYGQVNRVIDEKNILSKMSHPNIINMYATFNDEHHIYLVLEAVANGDLFANMRLRPTGKFSDRRTAFYAANIACAFQYIHASRIVYRDLKPENVLICDNGYLKLADFGLAKEMVIRSASLCGTPEYLAPEVIQRVGHGHEVDWWTLGIIIFEMLTGATPFQDGCSSLDLQEKIMHTEVVFPAFVSLEAVDLINRLLAKKPENRLGHLSDAVEVMQHAWFKGFDLETIQNQTANSHQFQ
eukprot:CAMPEP_0196571964 /NCGR_PEP_ID=MMETSP1081-20130531/2094_1 /TAXON_ID=36882 /ORGANISM="Pyramimonas amylifera, Strain CCMP720" /LENGTH=313 /DNA_ID=CAMNT_0041889113 /DNA_START=107 /DNA_END=1048 /DNA_ORIENTATION=+